MKMLPVLFLGIALLVGCGDDRKTPDKASEEASPAEDVAVVGDDIDGLEAPAVVDDPKALNGIVEDALTEEVDLDDPKTRDEIAGDALALEKLQERGPEGEELSYAPNRQIPYTGWVKSMHKNGQVSLLAHYKDGKEDGLDTRW